MRSKPVELRIVETGEGGEIAVARLPAKVYPQGAVNLESEFEAGKRYMAVLTMSAAQPVVLKAPIQVVPNQSYAALVGEPPEEFMSQPIIRTDAQVTVKEFIGDAGNTEWKKIEDNAWRLHSTELDKVTEKTRDIIMLFTRVEDGVEITRLIVDGNEHDRNTISHVVDRAVPLIIAAKYSGIWEYDENGTKSYVNITKEKSGRFKFIKGFKYEGKIGWSAHEVRNADGIYLKPLNGRLEGEFVSNNFYPTHGKDDRYKITLDAKSKTKLLYSVYSSMRGETDEREATKVSD